MSRRDLSALDRDIALPLGRILQEAFAHGIDCELIFGGLLAGGTEQGLYEISTTQNYVLGTRRVTPDGRTYRYSKSAGACYTGQLAGITQDKAIAVASAAAIAEGASEITFASQTFAADALKGGFIVIFGNPDSAPNNANCPLRGILSNDVCDASTLTITMDAALELDIETAQYCEVYYNPWGALSTAGGSNAMSFAGVANAYVSAASKYFWCQTWGPCWIAPQVASFASGAHRDCYCRHDGSIQDLGNSDVYDTNKQRIGFIIQANLTAGPLVMLQISP